MYFLKQRYANQLKFQSGVFRLPVTATGPLSLTGLVIRSLQTNSRAANTRYRTSHSTCIPCFVEAASAKGDLFSQSDNENRPIKTKPKGRRIGYFSPQDNNICCVDATRVDLHAPQTYTSSSIEAANILIKSN